MMMMMMMMGAPFILKQTLAISYTVTFYHLAPKIIVS